jgi:uncharacterized protein (DUF1330 family)
MATQPRPDQLEAFVAVDTPGPIHMVNLLKFKPRAEYPDGRESQLSGAEAYAVYGAGVSKLIAAVGGRFLYGGPLLAQLIGDGPLVWDAIGIVEYPSVAAFQQMTSSDAYQEIHVHRDAGLEHQLLIRAGAGSPTPQSSGGA